MLNIDRERDNPPYTFKLDLYRQIINMWPNEWKLIQKKVWMNSVTIRHWAKKKVNGETLRMW